MTSLNYSQLREEKAEQSRREKIQVTIAQNEIARDRRNESRYDMTWYGMICLG